MSARVKISPMLSCHCKQQNSNFVPTFSPRVTKRVFVGPVGIMNNPKSFNSIAGSVQPLEASAVDCFDNTLPSKG